MTSNTARIVRSAGKKQTLKALDELIIWAQFGTKFITMSELSRKLSLTATYILTGSAPGAAANVTTVRFFDNFKIQNPAEYRKVIEKLAKQLMALKVQVAATKNLTPESVIKLKTLI